MLSNLRRMPCTSSLSVRLLFAHSRRFPAHREGAAHATMRFEEPSDNGRGSTWDQD